MPRARMRSGRPSSITRGASSRSISTTAAASNSEMYDYLHGQWDDAGGIPLLPAGNNLKHHCIMGNDYYVTNEHRVSADGTHQRRPARSSAMTRSPGSITTATGCRSCTPRRTSSEGPLGDEAVNWLWKEWANVLRVRNDGVPVVGFTWYSLTDQVDWDTALARGERPRQPARPV